MEEIGVRALAHFGGFTFDIETLEMTWLAMAIVIIVSYLGTRSLKLVPSGCQNIIEMFVTGMDGQVKVMMGERGKLLAPFIVSLFMFLLVSNLLGLIPGFSSPTNDLNTTLGLAILVIGMVHVIGLKNQGMGWIAHFFKPMAFLFPINLVEELAKPITLAFRLFGNILAGEILILILLDLTRWWIIPSVLWLAFSIFISCVQAFIFTMLSTAYLANAVNEPEKEDAQ